MQEEQFKTKSLYISDELIETIKHHQQRTRSNSFSGTAIRLICKGIEVEEKERKNI